MSIWSRIADALAALAHGEGLSVVFDRLAGQARVPEHSVGFTIAVIALGAKLAKADGHVSRDEVTAFRRVFTIPPKDEAAAARVFNLARQDVAGYDAYAAKIAAMFRAPACAHGQEILIDVMDGLFHIALADGSWHPKEEAFLRHVAQIFGLDERCFRKLTARFVDGAPRDPYDVLGITPDTPMADARAAWRQAVKDNHPDRLMARGLPPEAMRMAEQRLHAINMAWQEINARQAA